MGTLDIAEEILHVSSTAGLSNYVIDLLEKKSALVSEHVTALERENVRPKADDLSVASKLRRC